MRQDNGGYITVLLLIIGLVLIGLIFWYPSSPANVQRQVETGQRIEDATAKLKAQVEQDDLERLREIEGQ